MKYNNMCEGIFLERPNRFIANVLIDGKKEKVHVKNTGRCKEILIKGTKVYLEKSNNPNRKTKYSLISAYKEDQLINIDSQVPNKVVFDAIKSNRIKELENIKVLKREVTFGNSRFDLYFEKDKESGFIEVKGVTLENNGLSLFPDAPTERGTKHIKEMIKVVESGLKGYIFFLIQMENIKYFTPNTSMDEKFSNALIEANKKGVNILAYNSIVKEDSIKINEKIEVLI
ncbi:DNA/RNA nuclease SfsA [Anaerosalibacter bizertensis]|uniref:Sugar fermentation stimulation protein homolog n=1 Tax=Anaerosalibacter bizertensis TaxID=932217 RepID=A0A844FJ92_9FIRM|nr:DNA/RNA nuclease SfsA [Anaerosalibacter bizertensis]MBU5293427.1 DNA/RNA nuclease SfsA [Anaerosalibacter bizertensis]MSS44124.1 DNA/RNA nuclease SfsA [Anaerosalibacter bizertensis]HHV27793.1 DNA/RNA nuclease SfsA [Tissierellia bacterium]